MSSDPRKAKQDLDALAIERTRAIPGRINLATRMLVTGAKCKKASETITITIAETHSASPPLPEEANRREEHCFQASN